MSQQEAKAGRSVLTRAACRAAVMAAALAAGAAQPAPADEAGRTVLLGGSYWRAFSMRGPGAVHAEPGGDAKAKPVDDHLAASPPPPAGWTGRDFDDGRWLWQRGPFSGGYVGWAHKYHRLGRSLICLRGKFAVADPDRVRKLTLRAAYAGGVAVYLNGREVGRAHLPAGKLRPETPGEAYPLECYVDEKGRPIPAPHDAARQIKAGAKDLTRRIGLRTARQLGPIDLPTDLLRKGVNVLAVEIHRSNFRPEGIGQKVASWSHVGLADLRLSAEGDEEAVQPNFARPAGQAKLRVWPHDPYEVLGPADWADPNDPPRPVRLVGVRGGFFSGAAVVSSPAAVAGLKCRIGDFTRAGGKPAIPAGNVRLRYAALSRDRVYVLGPGCKTATFAVLAEAPPERIEPAAVRLSARDRARLHLPVRAAPAAIQPVWITVRIPPTAAPGRYAGALTVSAEGVAAAQVPVELEVIDWTLPETRDFQAFVAINQSPETLARKYGSPMWSAEHLAAMATSWELLGYLGNNLLIVPLVTETQYGNDESLVRWVRQADGTYDFDFTDYDALLKLALKHCRLRVISYQVNLATGWSQAKPDKPVSVTVVDPKTGKRKPMQLPAYGSAESKRLWKPLIEALKARNAAAGVGKNSLLTLGIAQDSGIHKEIVAQFKEIFPEAKWHYGAHNRPHGWRKDFYGFSEYLYVPGLRKPGGKRRYGWQQRPLVVMSQRAMDGRQRPTNLRTMVERALLLGDSGPGRMCLDYWRVEGARSGSHGGSLYSRFPASSASQRTPHLKRLALPGPAGALATVKVEAFREGLQEAEARIFIEKALVAGRLDADLAARCQAVLDERIAFCQATHAMPYSSYDPYWIACADWRQLSRKLYAAAAEVGRKRGK